MVSGTMGVGPAAPAGAGGPAGVDATDRIVLGCIGFLLVGALAYTGVYGSFGAVALVGALILAAAFASLALSPVARSIALAVLGMAMVGLVIHAARGHAEAHFAVFAFLATLLAFRDWRPIVAGAGAIAVHHLSFNYFQQWGWGPICFTDPGLGVVIEHAAYVVVEAGALIFLAERARRDFAAGAEVTQMVERLVDEHGRLRLDGHAIAATSVAGKQLAGVIRTLDAAMREVREAAETIRTAASEVASGNHDLSARTERQAADVQRTGSAMTQMSSSVSSSAQALQSASKVAGQTQAVAREGDTRLASAASTMKRIEAAAARVASITSAIDGIAFQTNILALNAAVEAARAGDAGRGFAVVASEVRALAQKSAEASREIKTLIDESQRSVSAGTTEIDQSVKTMADMLRGAEQVHALLEQVAAATAEQAQGIAEVERAIGGLDGDAQRNAALVEQSAAAASSLDEQAKRLTGTLERVVA